MVVSRGGEKRVECDACVATWDERGVLHLNTQTVYVNNRGEFYVRKDETTVQVEYDSVEGWVMV